MVLFTTVFTDALSSDERTMLGQHMGTIDKNLDHMLSDNGR